MKVTYFGTTVLLFDDGKDRVLFDCHVTRPSIRAYLCGQLRTDTAVAERVIRDFSLTHIRAIFISHSHHDHVMDMPYFANACSSEVYGSASALNVARGGNVPEERLHLFTGGKTFTVSDFRITVINSLHSKPGFFNNDLGKTIDVPLVQPARGREYKEGGSFDFLVEHSGNSYLIRPSYNFVPGQLDSIHADALFLGIAGLSKDNDTHKQRFWQETIDKVHPSVVIPIHWDNFFVPLYGPLKSLPRAFEDTGLSISELSAACAQRGISCMVLPPLASADV